MTDISPGASFLVVFSQLQTFYADLDQLCLRDIPGRLETTLKKMGHKDVAIVDKRGNPSKPTKLEWTSEVRANSERSVYLPNPVCIRIKCDDRRILLAALLSADNAPDTGPALLVALLDSWEKDSAALADAANAIASLIIEERPDSKRKGFLVRLDEFSREKIGGDRNSLEAVIDNKIAERLGKLLSSSGTHSGQL